MNARTLPRKTLAALAALGLLAVLAGCDQAPEKPRKTASVKLLPDTPPPPPPPPRPEDKPPPPKPDDKPAPQDVPKPADTPEPAALKSDEVAGDGPGNGLTAGAVTKDYAGEKLGTVATVGGTGTGGGETTTNRLAFNAYANATTRALNEYLARDKNIKLRDYQVHVLVWINSSGGVQRFELTDSSGDPDTDAALRAALSRFAGMASAPPPRLPLPLRLRVSNRMMG